jgi:hypothetical protein
MHGGKLSLKKRKSEGFLLLFWFFIKMEISSHSVNLGEAQ